MGTLARNELTEIQYFLKILILKWCNREIGILTTTNSMIT